MLFKSSGPLRYSTDNKGLPKLIVEVDPGISGFYRSLIPKWHKVNSQMYAPHISVVRKEPVIPNRNKWEAYEGYEVDFLYSNYIYNGQVYWWLNAFSKKLEEIRLELGLPVSSPYTLPPEGFDKCFHLTLGNSKNV